MQPRSVKEHRVEDREPDVLVGKQLALVVVPAFAAPSELTDVERLGTVGPAARAAGAPLDVRSTSTRLDYAGFECRLPDRPTGDVRARLEQRALELEGYRVRTATNGKEGLAALPGMATPCLILLDLMMPVMDGWAFAEALRQDDKLASIPVVVVTAFADKARPVRQASGVLKKPVSLEYLLQMVRQYCH